MTASVSYTHRLHAFHPTKTWMVGNSGIGWKNQNKEGESGFIPVEKIRAIRLRFEPSRAETRRVGLHIYAPYDYHITNIDYQGPLNFELNKNDFLDFVLAVHKLFPPDTKTVFHKGSKMGAYIANVLISAFVLLMLLFIAPLVSLTGIPSATNIFRIVMIVIFLPILAQVIIRNKPSTYRPDTIPMEML